MIAAMNSPLRLEQLSSAVPTLLFQVPLRSPTRQDPKSHKRHTDGYLQHFEWIT